MPHSRFHFGFRYGMLQTLPKHYSIFASIIGTYIFLKANMKRSLRRELLPTMSEISLGERLGGACFFKRHCVAHIIDEQRWEDLTLVAKEFDMSYLIWPMIGAVIAVIIGAGPHRRAFRPSASILASAFGATIGGMISDGVLHSRAGAITFASLTGAVIGALIFCWAVRERESDVEP